MPPIKQTREERMLQKMEENSARARKSADRSLDDALVHPVRTPVTEDDVEGLLDDDMRAAIEKLSSLHGTSWPHMRGFLAAFARTCSFLPACRAAGISRSAVFYWQKTHPEFNVLLAKAKEIFTQSLKDEAVRRAVEGVVRPIYQRGELVGYERNYSDSLMLALLQAHSPDEFAKRTKTELTGAGGGPVQIQPVVDMFKQRLEQSIARAKPVSQSNPDDGQ